MKPADIRALAEVRAELGRVIRYDDESIVADKWVRQRYDCGCFASLAPARQATVETAWHEAGHAVACGAVLAEYQPQELVRVLLDPAGHPFCLWVAESP